MKRVTAPIIAGVLVLTLLSAGTVHFSDWTEPPIDGPPRPHFDVRFSGDIVTGQGTAVDGKLWMDTLRVPQSGFDRVSIRLYGENGSLLAADCLGRITEESSISITNRYQAYPEYVVFASPDFWEYSENGPFSITYRYRYDEEYSYARAAIPSDYPIDVTRHSPCA